MPGEGTACKRKLPSPAIVELPEALAEISAMAVKDHLGLAFGEFAASDVLDELIEQLVRGFHLKCHGQTAAAVDRHDEACGVDGCGAHWQPMARGELLRAVE